jgi:hypothetical protein
MGTNRMIGHRASDSAELIEPSVIENFDAQGVLTRLVPTTGTTAGRGVPTTGQEAKLLDLRTGQESARINGGRRPR